MYCPFKIDPSETNLPSPEQVARRKMRLASGTVAKKPQIVTRAGENSENNFVPTSSHEERTILFDRVRGLVAMSIIASHYKAVPFKGKQRRTVADIVRAIAEKHEVTVADIKGARRAHVFVSARMEAYYTIASERPDMSYPDIGFRLGGRDHTTVMHGVRAYAQRNGLPPVVRS